MRASEQDRPDVVTARDAWRTVTADLAPERLVFLDESGVATLRPGDIVVMDNLSAHHVDGVRQRIEAGGAQLWCLPPYSPDLNPIELWFAKLKLLLRTARRRTVEELWATVAECLRLFSATECRNYFRHCGYSAAVRL